MLAENLVKVFSADAGNNFVIKADRNALGAFAQAEGGAQIDLFGQPVTLEAAFHQFNNGIGTTEMAGAADANGNIHSQSPFKCRESAKRP